jgi:UDP-glucuronate 4-epimerase
VKFLVTGSAGFIGFHLAQRLLNEGHVVTGFDAFTPYYDVSLKRRRQTILERYPRFNSVPAGLEDAPALRSAAMSAEPDVIVHLAAQAGVRYSAENPNAYLHANILGSWNLLEIARVLAPKHLLLASTSSVYGASTRVPFAESNPAAEPLSLYAATKLAMEALGHSQAHLHGIPTTVLRFFTVYGPWGRPDMALFKFIDAILKDRAIQIYGHGRMQRDFTYIDDVIEAVIRLVDIAPAEENRIQMPDVADTLSTTAPYRVVNIGGGRPVDLLEFIGAIERTLGKTAKREMLPMQPGDVPTTFADTRLLEALTGFRPGTTVDSGVRAFADWYRANIPKATIP